MHKFDENKGLKIQGFLQNLHASIDILLTFGPILLAADIGGLCLVLKIHPTEGT